MWLKIINFIKKNQLVLLILAWAGFLRFWNLTNLIHFTLDEELEAFIVRNIVLGYHFPAIGVSVAPVGIHLSPLFYYLAAIPFWLGNLSPIAWSVTASLLGIVTTYILFLVSQRIFSVRAAYFAALLYAGSFLMVLYDKHFWNVTPIPLISLLTIFSLYQIVNRNFRWAMLLALVLGIGLSSHMSSLSLVILVLIFWIKERLPIIQKWILSSLGVLFLTQLPLVIFEIRHNFSQTQALGKFLSGEHSGIVFQRVIDNLMLLPKVFSRLLYTFGSHDYALEHTYNWWEIIYRDANIPLLMLLLAALLLIIFVNYLFKESLLLFVSGSAKLLKLSTNSNKIPGKRLEVKPSQSENYIGIRINIYLIIITLISLVLYGILFKGGIFEFYLAVLFPSLFMMTGYFIDRVWSKNILGKLLVSGCLSLFLIGNGLAVFTAFHSFGLGQKIQIINWVKNQINDQDYQLESIGVGHKYEGYRYLFEKYYKAPVKSYVDPELSWLYQSSVSNVLPSLLVVVSSSENINYQQINQQKNYYIPNKISEKQFGLMDVMVVLQPSI